MYKPRFLPYPPQVEVEILDADDDLAPRFLLGPAANASASESLQPGAEVARFAAAGVDDVAYELTSDPSGLFEVDRRTGAVRLRPGRRMDREKQVRHLKNELLKNMHKKFVVFTKVQLFFVSKSFPKSFKN